MIKNGTVLVGMSGGVDSTIAAFRLRDMGMEVQGIHFLLWKWQTNISEEDKEKKRIDQLCKQIDIPIFHYDARELFHQTIVINQKEKLKKGLTPNPCIRCNPFIKFKLLDIIAREKGIDYIATGHYAINRKKPAEKFGVFRARDTSKDQTYFLCYLTQNFLGKTIFPLGESLKIDNYAMAGELGLDFSGKRESQDLCYLGENLYERFLDDIRSELHNPGDIVDINRSILGQHEGLAYFTIGQRKGIRIPAEEPYYVIHKDILKNQLVVGHKDDIGYRGIKIKDVNWISGEKPNKKNLFVKIRYQSKINSCEIIRLDEDTYSIIFDEAVRDPAPGQYAVFYDGEELIGGGEIVEVF
jgi:tRNA-specific 2-thiouridylase